MECMTKQDVRRRAFQKRRRGEALTAEEQEEFRAYYRERDKLRCVFYCTDADEKDHLHGQARDAGYASFADWCRDMIHRGAQASTRTEQEWNDAMERLEKAEARFEDQLAMTHDLLDRANRYERERNEARIEAQELRQALTNLEAGA